MMANKEPEERGEAWAMLAEHIAAAKKGGHKLFEAIEDVDDDPPKDPSK